MLLLLKRGTSVVSAVALLVAQIAPVFAQTGQNPTQGQQIGPGGSTSSPLSANTSRSQFTRRDYESCQTSDEATFRMAIREITLAALRDGTGELDYAAIVKDQWRTGGLDRIVDTRVDIAVDQVRDETAWSELLKSLAYRKQAQELARAVAERTYRSEAIKQALEELATSVGAEIGRAIVLTTADAAAPAQRCLQAYLGPRYGSTVARSVNQDAGAAFEIDPNTSKADVSTSSVLLETSTGITGAVLLLVRRQMARMAQRIGQRLVGSVLGRLVSVVAGGVGIVLIAKEFWELRNGVLPIIAAEMKSDDSKAKVRDELANSIREQIAAHLDELSARTADRIVDIWHEFRRAHAKVVQLAEREPKFKTFLDTARPAQLPRLDEIVAIVVEKEGEGAVLERLDNGTLHLALNKMPEPGMQIAREQRSLPTALAWTALAGSDLDEVVTFGIHKLGSPETFTKSGLSRVLALDDRLAIMRVAGMGREARDVLLELERPRLVELTRSLTEAELATLARYLTGLGEEASQRVLRMVAGSPARMRLIGSGRVRDAILSSRDQTAAVGMMLSDAPPIDIGRVIQDFQLVWSGRVHPVLLWDKHPGFVVIAGLFVLMMLLMLRRLIFGRRLGRRKGGSGRDASGSAV